jgi:hypothetical protein
MILLILLTLLFDNYNDYDDISVTKFFSIIDYLLLEEQFINNLLDADGF